MDHDPLTNVEETAALLQQEQNSARCEHDEELSSVTLPKSDGAPEFVLPIALLAALAMASTVATAHFTYATLLCKDAQHCEGDETTRYASLVAVTTCLANLLGLSALGFLRKVVTTNRKVGLMLWMLCRSMSAVMLLLGVSFENIYVALFGRVFEGMASDNLLHFTLNAVYAQSEKREKASILISYSLALYMIGISVSPFVVGLFKNFTISFFIALGLFGLSFIYLQLCIVGESSRNIKGVSGSNDERPVQSRSSDGFQNVLRNWLRTASSPLKQFQQQPTHLLVGFSLFAYNIVQSYIFNALLVHTSVRFGFTGRENGFIISIAHSIASAYIFTTVSLLPRACRYFQSRKLDSTPLSSSSAHWDTLLAMVSLAAQTLSLATLGFANRPWQIYIITVPLAVGLSTPSFIKAAFICRFENGERPAALAALAMMETFGSVLGPVVLGGLQAFFSADGDVFFTAAGLVLASLISLGLGSLKSQDGKTDEDEDEV
ncbi:MFS general substrate transporter [Melanomma pulvis-pyrius CBS 109.77]|uniref:MFS general substrate transporter n=1 Tax=Melanomma pulvis-pyrius CBS 109.77 TaxID=1314802 RepID=A0A6A6XHM6_9PLEO|nr:MFS general substrate transporter [Melanomma pulvis-pyrius CBS 109.77]